MNLKDVKRLVFVCKGNICRSAFAESVAVSSGIPSVSCGVATRNELPADNMAIEAAYRRGRDLSGHLTRSIDTLALNRHDLLVAMEPWHINAIKELPGEDTVCSLLGVWGMPRSPYIHDPYGKGAQYFDSCFGFIEQSVEMLGNEILKA